MKASWHETDDKSGTKTIRNNLSLSFNISFNLLFYFIFNFCSLILGQAF